MTQLLVSVRSGEEAEEALAGGAHLIDVKEPRRGPLGAADVSTWREIARVVAGQAPLSAALGELAEERCFELASQTEGFAYVKAGLAGCARLADWPTRWRRLQQRLPPSTKLVGVIYADFKLAAAPSPDEVIRVARTLRLTTLLIDTFEKGQGSLWDVLPLAQLVETIAAARAAGMQIALAGSLTLRTLPKAKALAPDWIAVRGAACAGGQRLQTVTKSAVRRLVENLSQPLGIRGDKSCPSVEEIAGIS